MVTLINDVVTLPASSLHVICGWCQVVLKDGAPDGPISHGMCQTCSDRLTAELDAVEAERELRRVVLDVERRIENAARLRRIA